MEAIILAAGRGTRMMPLTLAKPKPLLPLQNRPLLHWSLRSLRGIVSRVLIVASYLKEQIAAYMAEQNLFADYTLVEQLPAPLGTGHALRCCQPHLHGDDFLVINGDDLFARESLHTLSQVDYGILAMPRTDYARYGVVLRDAQGAFAGIHEKPPAGSYQSPAPCSIGAYKLRRDVFDHAPSPSMRGEIEITDMVTAVAARRRVEVVEASWWLPIGDARALHVAQVASLTPLGPPD